MNTDTMKENGIRTLWKKGVNIIVIIKDVLA